MGWRPAEGEERDTVALAGQVRRMGWNYWVTAEDLRIFPGKRLETRTPRDRNPYWAKPWRDPGNITGGLPPDVARLACFCLQGAWSA